MKQVCQYYSLHRRRVKKDLIGTEYGDGLQVQGQDHETTRAEMICSLFPYLPTFEIRDVCLHMA